MAVNAGTVYYTVDANTQKAIDSAEAMNKSLDTTKNKMSTLDTQVTKTSRAVNSGLSSMGRSAGQVGVQVQQLVGQIQGGQDKFQAFAAQAADIGIVLGVPLLGVIVALSAAIGGTLSPSLLESKDATEELEKSLKSIEKVIKLNSDGVNVLSNDYAELVKKSKDLATAQLLLTKVKVDQVMNQAADAAEQAFDKFDTFFNALDVSANVSVFENLDATMQRTGKSVIDLIENTDLYGTGLTQLKSAIENVNDELGLTTDQSALVLRRFAEFRQQKTPEAFQALSNTLLNIANTSRSKVSPEFVELTSLISNQAFAAADAAEKSRLLEKALNGIGIETENGVKALKQWDDLAERLRVGTESLRSEQLKLEKAITLRKAAEEGASQATIDSISSSYDKKIASEQEAESERRLAKAKREKAAAERDATRAEKESKEASKSFIKNFGISGEEDVIDESDPNSVATGVSRAIAQENESLIRQLEEQRSMIQLYQELEVGDAEAHAAALVAIDKRMADEKAKNNQAILSASSDFFGASADLVGTFAGEQDNAYKALFAVSKAFAIANAAIQLQTAIANASALPWPTNIPAIAQAVSFGTQIASSLASVSYAGGRLYGGSVQAGNMYRINENGAPEVFNAANGQQYMLPNTRGEVVSNKSATQSGAQNSEQGGNVSINMQVINEAAADGYQVRQEMTEDGVKLLIAKYFDQNIDNGVSSVLGKKGTKTNKTLTSRYDTRNKL